MKEAQPALPSLVYLKRVLFFVLLEWKTVAVQAEGERGRRRRPTKTLWSTQCMFFPANTSIIRFKWGNKRLEKCPGLRRIAGGGVVFVGILFGALPPPSLCLCAFIHERVFWQLEKGALE